MKIFLDIKLHLYTNTNLVTTGPRAYFTTDNENLYLITGTGILMSTPINLKYQRK